MSFEKEVTACISVLQKGGLILYPTDTVWGIGCDATNKKAVKKIIALKQRPPDKSMIVLMADEKDILKYTTNTNISVFDFLKHRKKPTTVIFENVTGLADNLLADDGSIGIRLVKDDFCKTMMKRFQKPIVSTSANISGQPTPANFSQIAEEIKNGVDYVANHRQNEKSVAVASGIIRFNRNGTITVIRN